MARTVAIVGAHQDTRHLAPYDDPDVEIWTFNECGMMPWCRRVSAVFQPHLPTVYLNPENRADRHYAEWIRQTHGFPIYLIDVDPQVPASVRYPLEEIYAAFPTVERRMFTGVATYALAYAAFVGVDKVLLYGIEAEYYSEYKHQREALAFWVGVLQGRGITVERHCADNIFVNPLYGRENIWKQEPAKYRARLAELLREMKLADRKMLKAKVGSQEWIEALTAHYVAEGKREECQRYLAKIEAMRKATGEAILDKTEMERAAKDLLPQIHANRDAANKAMGARDFNAWRKYQTEAAKLAGRWKENTDMAKAAPSAVSYIT